VDQQRNTAGLPGGIYPGIDLFVTPNGGATFQDFSTTPIPAGFFGPGSDPFTGKVVYGGQPIAPLIFALAPQG
jgi:hypothetical protein